MLCLEAEDEQPGPETLMERLRAARAELGQLAATLLAARTDTALHLHTAQQQDQATAALRQRIKRQQVALLIVSHVQNAMIERTWGMCPAYMCSCRVGSVPNVFTS